MEQINALAARLWNSRVLRDSLPVLGSSVVSQGIGLLVSILLARQLGEFSYGRVILASSIVMTLISVLNIRTGDGSTRFLTEALAQQQHDRALTIFAAALLLDVGLMLVTLAASLLLLAPVSRLFPEGETVLELARIFRWIIPFALLQPTLTAIATARKDFHAYSLISLSKQIALLVGLLLLAHKGAQAVMWGYVLADGVEFLLWLIVGGVHARRSFRGAQLLRLREAFRELLPMAFHTTLSETLKGLFTNATILILGALRPANEVSFFKIAQSAVSLPAVGVTPVRLVIFPNLVEAWALKDERRLRRTIGSFALYGGGVTALASTLLVILAPWLLSSFYGPDYLPAAPIITVLAIGYIIDNALLWMRPITLAANRPALLTQVSLVGSVTRTLLVVLLVAWMGVAGAAWAFVASMIIHLALCLFYVLPSVGLGLGQQGTGIKSG